MEHEKEKSKGPPRRINRRRIIVLVLILLACAVFGIVYVINSQKLPPLPSFYDDNPVIRVPAFPDITLTLDITQTAPEYGVNDGAGVQIVPGNLATKKLAFASSHRDAPYSAIDGLDTVWESDGSTGTWWYVDLGEATTFRVLIPSIMVEGDDLTLVETYYIISDDLKTWRVVYADTDYETYIPWAGPIIVLPQNVTARYVGLYAQNWGGGRGAVVEFVVLP